MKNIKAWAIVSEGKLLEIRTWGDPEIYLTKAEAQRHIRSIKETTMAGMRGDYDDIKIAQAEIRIKIAR
jgi:hypothetical protein